MQQHARLRFLQYLFKRVSRVRGAAGPFPKQVEHLERHIEFLAFAGRTGILEQGRQEVLRKLSAAGGMLPGEGHAGLHGGGVEFLAQ